MITSGPAHTALICEHCEAALLRTVSERDDSNEVWAFPTRPGTKPVLAISRLRQGHSGVSHFLAVQWPLRPQILRIINQAFVSWHFQPTLPPGPPRSTSLVVGGPPRHQCTIPSNLRCSTSPSFTHWPLDAVKWNLGRGGSRLKQRCSHHTRHPAPRCRSHGSGYCLKTQPEPRALPTSAAAQHIQVRQVWRVTL